MTPTTLDICRKSLRHTAHLLAYRDDDRSRTALVHVRIALQVVETLFQAASRKESA